MRAQLDEVAEAGSQARWSLLMSLEEYAGSALARAHTSFSLEVAESTGVEGPLFDPTSMGEALTRFLLGADDHPGKVPQILDWLATPTACARSTPGGT